MRKSNKLLAIFLLFGLLTSGCSLLPTTNGPRRRSSSQEEVVDNFDAKTHEIYELYLANGGTLTYEEWLESIKGPKGDKGDKGDTGATGQKGDKGDAGQTPSIGDNGNWWIGNTDTGVSATGEQGVGISTIAYNGENELIVTFEDGRVVNLGAVTASVHQHEYECVSEPATCTVDGYFQFTCKTCGHIETVVDKAQGHNFDAYRDRISPTCTTDGVKFRRCLTCGYEETEVIPAHDHEFSENCVYDANKHWHYCLTCGVVAQEGSHTFTNNTCSVCNYTKSSATSASGLIFGMNEDNASYSLVSIGTCSDTIIDIPSEYNGYPVTKISSGAFQNSSVTSITMPDSIEQISERAFYGCTSLASVCLSNSLKEIPSSCFYNNRALPSIVIPEGVRTIRDSAFYNCSALTSLIIPNTVTSIDSSAFGGCSKLTSVVIPSSVRTLSSNVFSNCRLLTSVILNYGLKQIGWSTFSSCQALESITIPSSVNYIQPYAFQSCSKLTSVAFEQSEGWYTENGESLFKEVLSDPELAANQIKNSSSYWTCRLVASELYSIGGASLSVGGTKKLITKIEPETATSAITFESADDSIATVDANGIVTAVASGRTQIIVKSAGLTFPVDIIVGSKLYYLSGSNTSSFNYRDSEYTATINRVSWKNSGHIYRTGWWSTNAIYSDCGKIQNTTPIDGVSTVMISFFMDPGNDYGWLGYWNGRIYAGKTADSLKEIYANQYPYSQNNGDVRIKTEGTGIKDGSREIQKYTVTFSIPEGCSYFCFDYQNWNGPIQEIAFF